MKSLARLTRPLKLPVRVVHELTHIVAATPWLDDWRLVIGPTDSPDELGVDVAFADDAPAWGIALAYVAPLICGLVGLIGVGIGILIDGIPLPQTTYELALWSAAGLGWYLYSIPSSADIHGAISALGGESDE